MQKTLTAIDEVVFLQGDEDGDVWAMCRVCDSPNTMPVIWYTPESNRLADPKADVVVHSIVGLMNALVDHIDTHLPST